MLPPWEGAPGGPARTQPVLVTHDWTSKLHAGQRRCQKAATSWGTAHLSHEHEESRPLRIRRGKAD
jgi:hypothetical protein